MLERVRRQLPDPDRAISKHENGLGLKQPPLQGFGIELAFEALEALASGHVAAVGDDEEDWRQCRDRGEELNYLLVSYALERLLYRLSVSPFADRFVLKGASLFRVWLPAMHRTTLDLDLLGLDFHTAGELKQVFRQVAALAPCADGMAHDPATVVGSEIREGALYHGVRIRLEERLGNVRLPIQVEIGFGDAVQPPPEACEFPPLLPFPPACIKAYSRHTVVAEKLEAMVVLDLANSRMKGFYDILDPGARVRLRRAHAGDRRRGHLLPARHPHSQGAAAGPDRGVRRASR